MNRKVIATTVVLLIVSASGAVMALDGPQGRKGHMGFPQEAIEACKGKSEGATVEITTPRGDKIKATCKLVAVPEGGFRGPKAPPAGETQDSQ